MRECFPAVILEYLKVLLGLYLFVVSIFSACGTAHYHMPPQPLDKGKWQLSVSWHYDFNSLASHGAYIVPEVNGYVGVTDDLVIGTGFTTPGFISHASMGKYFESSPDNYWIVWVHRRVMSPHNNPTLELGFSYSTADSSLSSMYSAGLGFGQYSSWGRLFDCGNLTPKWLVKYSHGGTDFGIDLVHYHGNTLGEIKQVFPVWPPQNDTVLALHAGEALELVEVSHDSLYLNRSQNAFLLKLTSGDTLMLYGPRWYADNFRPIDHLIDDWVGDGMSFVTFDSSWAIIDTAQIRSAIATGAPVIITRAPREFEEKAGRALNWLEDTSVGWAVFAWPK